MKQVSSSEFAGKFGQWAFAAQSTPVMVTNQKTGMVMGYFVSAAEFDELQGKSTPQAGPRLTKPTRSRVSPVMDDQRPTPHPEIEALIRSIR